MNFFQILYITDTTIKYFIRMYILSFYHQHHSDMLYNKKKGVANKKRYTIKKKKEGRT